LDESKVGVRSLRTAEDISVTFCFLPMSQNLPLVRKSYADHDIKTLCQDCLTAT